VLATIAAAYPLRVPWRWQDGTNADVAVACSHEQERRYTAIHSIRATCQGGHCAGARAARNRPDSAVGRFMPGGGSRWCHDCELADCFNNLAYVYRAAGRTAEAEALRTEVERRSWV